MSQACTWYVYALKDPRDGAVRYVGTTRNPKERLRGHLDEQSDSRKAAWIADLRTCGLTAEMCILESGDGARNEQARCERHWIEHYRTTQPGEPSEGLFNRSRGGETGFPPYNASSLATVAVQDGTGEPQYSVVHLAALWGLGPGAIRKLVQDEPTVVKIQVGRKQSSVRYRIPESVVQRIYARLRNAA
jgi:hypothetical protein